MLGSRFPTSLRRDHIRRTLHPGHVIYVWCRHTTPPKDKYLVFIGFGETPAFFVVNSGINDFIRIRPDLLQSQVELECSNHPFLPHDSIVDCSGIKKWFSIDELSEQILGDETKIKGELTDAARKAIVGVVQRAKTISAVDKEFVLTSLG